MRHELRHAESGKSYFTPKSTVLLLEVKNVSIVEYLRFLLQPAEIVNSMLKLLANSDASLRLKVNLAPKLRTANSTGKETKNEKR